MVGRAAAPRARLWGVRAEMSNLREVASGLRSQEEALAEGYRALQEAAGREVERKVVAQIVNFQRLQLASLALLADGLPEPFLGFGHVTADDVNMREGPGGRYQVVGKLSRGEMVIIQGYAGYWVQVLVPGGQGGFVFKDYVHQEMSA